MDTTLQRETCIFEKESSIEQLARSLGPNSKIFFNGTFGRYIFTPGGPYNQTIVQGTKSKNSRVVAKPASTERD